MNETPSHLLSTRVGVPYAATVIAVREALSDQGFGILTEIDLAATLKAKLDLDVAPQLILGACPPVLAYAAVQADPSVAALLPCNVVVRALDDGTCLVEAIDPAAMMSLAGAGADAEGLRAVAAEARRRLSAALGSLTALPAPQED